MPWPSDKIPKLRPHASGRAIATFNGHDHYFGKFGTLEAQASYDAFLAEWLASGRGVVPADRGRSTLTINEVILKYLGFAEGYYRKGGEPTSEIGNIRSALRDLRKLYGRKPAAEFGPLALKAFRESCDGNEELTRSGVNRRVKIVKRMFKWAVSEELIPAVNLHALQAVPGLKKGRSRAPDPEPIGPIPEDHVDAIRTHVSRQVWAMIELQRLTGMRPGEVTAMRTCDVNTSGRVWVYTPKTHKTEHHERERPIYLGPRAQALLKPWLRMVLAVPLFQPREAEAERREFARAARRTKVQPSQRERRVASPKKRAGERYDKNSYRRAIDRACERAGVPPWHPNQLRHNAGTRFRREFGLDVAQVLLGHATADTTEIYAESDAHKAMAAAEKAG